ncbi:hypothetical protein LOTGIDRAFT_118731 [Lottia gigantea]|uniref:Globin n=1 Tax=Lottia gigantea TaxID=225164 RepID=V4ABF4_LOTGI|nr:hypothetical protein LOTGIDRAFT_118731 [Lottia gigantea]ESO94142.1 hypothetical protein LOTGIDRAFT_118731 [Lottia gigantea]
MDLVRETWNIAREDIARVGVVAFLSLFEKYPETQNIFLPFRGLTVDELQHSARLREHGLRVMLTVEKCIARLDKPEKLQDLLHDLGQKHVEFNTKVDYIDMVGPQFIQAIRPVVKSDWTPEVEDAWEDFFKLLIYFMKEAMCF